MNKNNENKYPTLKVITLYPLLGGAVGILLPAISLLLYSTIIQGDEMDGTLLSFAFFLMLGAAYGFIPALLAGCILAYFKVRILNLEHYVKVFLIGWLATFVPGLSMILIGLIREPLTEQSALSLMSGVVVFMLLAVIGGISSTILAKFILPKS